MSAGLGNYVPPSKTGIEISDDWYRNLCRVVEESLTTGLEKTIPNRYLLVLTGKKNGLVSAQQPPVCESINFGVDRHLLNAGEK